MDSDEAVDDLSPEWLSAASKRLAQVTHLYPAILCNILVTNTLWCYLYELKQDPNLIPAYLLSQHSNFTTGNDLLDSLLNGVSSIVLVAGISFIMLFLVMYNKKTIVQYWLSFACLAVLWGLFPCVLRDFLAKLQLGEWLQIALLGLGTSIYAGLGMMVFLTNTMPLSMHQVYVIVNCSLTSTFYLRALPAQTIWFLMILVVIWDSFAVLSSFGPLQVAQQRAADYSNTMLRMLMFERMKADVQQESAPVEPEEALMEDLLNHDVGTAESISEEKLVQIRKEQEEEEKNNQPVERSALDALQDSNSLHLGMGDFIFYSVLVGKSLADGGMLCACSSCLGVLVGYFLTDSVLTKPEATFPALPVSLTIGILLHMSVMCFVNPFLEALSSPMILL